VHIASIFSLLEFHPVPILNDTSKYGPADVDCRRPLTFAYVVK
jgi:hypothetical protein